MYEGFLEEEAVCLCERRKQYLSLETSVWINPPKFLQKTAAHAETEYNKSQVIHQKCLFHKKRDYIIIYYNLLLSYNQFYIKKIDKFMWNWSKIRL